MKITVSKAAPDRFALRFGTTEVALDGKDLKDLLLQLTRLLTAGPAADHGAEDATAKFVRRIRDANDLGLQRFLLTAAHEDVLVLLKVAENDPALSKKFYGNMSERARKIVGEDLAYAFKEGVPAAKVAAAIGRLIETAERLEAEGTPVYGNPAKR